MRLLEHVKMSYSHLLYKELSLARSCVITIYDPILSGVTDIWASKKNARVGELWESF